MIEGVVVGERAGARPSHTVEAAGRAPERRRNRAWSSDAGVGAALSASFLGLLSVRSAVEADEVEPVRTAPAEGLAVPPPPDEGPIENGTSGNAPSGGVDLAAGSVLTAGSLIDPALLTRLAGEARFDDLPLRLLRPEPATLPVEDAPAPAAAAAPAIAIALAAPPSGPLPVVEQPSEPDGDPGPIGEEIVGGEEDEVLAGGPDDDRIDGGSGNDTISGGGGDDLLAGGTGDDRLDGGSGDDTLSGGTGDDAVLGGDGDDALDGGPGDDFLDGGPGDDVATGGSGNDAAVIGSPGDLVFEDPWGPGGGGRDTLVVEPDFGAQLERAFPVLAKGGLATFMIGDAVLGSPPPGAPLFKQQVPPNVENVRLTGSEAHAVVGDGEANVIEGNEAPNLLSGGAGDDRIRGGAGNDRLFGGPGDDLLLGDAGDDLLDGGAGADALYGGAGDDVYVMGLAEAGVDRIFDLEGANRIRIDGADPNRLSARFDGDDLHLAYEDRDLAVIVGHRGREEALAGIEIDGRLHEPATFLRVVEPPTDDLLAGFFEPGGPNGRVAVDGAFSPPDPAADPFEPSGTVPEIFPGADLWVEETTSSLGEARPGVAEEDRPAPLVAR
ncbi:MAG: hypothetical protein KatS3mg117_2474 [Geminicoccaceae bacterium]|jgi:hypothetical protein|nr:MAG: hypothetical protein KatS3mg117_2474 [Geminicoccaceae bacterium]